MPCKSRNLCCKQVISPKILEQQPTLQTAHTIYSINVLAKGSSVPNAIYICISIISGGQKKSQIKQFNLRLNSHRKDNHKNDSPQVDQYFKLSHHNFNQHAHIFPLIEQLHNPNIVSYTAMEKTRRLLDMKLQTYPNCLNAGSYLFICLHL